MIFNLRDLQSGTETVDNDRRKPADVVSTKPLDKPLQSFVAYGLKVVLRSLVDFDNYNQGSMDCLNRLPQQSDGLRYRQGYMIALIDCPWN